MARAVLLITLALTAAPTAQGAPAGDGEQARERWARAAASAERYARGRRGRVSFALVDGQGKLRGLRGGRRYRSASVVKAMLLVAYLNRRGVRSRRLDFFSRVNLRPMIVRSDNGAASRIYSIVHARGLRRLARRAGMRRFRAHVKWGETQITAADQARFFARVDRLVPGRHRRFARRLLRGIVRPQRWGIPRALPRDSRVLFKGGWRRGRRGWIVHQVALVERGGRRVSLAVLTDRNRSQRYGHETIRGIAKRALRPLAAD